MAPPRAARHATTAEPSWRYVSSIATSSARKPRRSSRTSTRPASRLRTLTRPHDDGPVARRSESPPCRCGLSDTCSRSSASAARRSGSREEPSEGVANRVPPWLREQRSGRRLGGDTAFLGLQGVGGGGESLLVEARWRLGVVKEGGEEARLLGREARASSWVNWHGVALRSRAQDGARHRWCRARLRATRVRGSLRRARA